MSNQAKVTSSDALDMFRAALILFQSKARRSVDDAADELRRTRMWLQYDQRTKWENELKLCRKKLERAEQELLSAKLSGLRDNIQFQMNAVRKAKAALEHAEEKLRHVRKWSQNFDAIADPLGKRLEGLRQYIDFDLPKGISFLVQASRIIEEYAETHMIPTAPTSIRPPRRLREQHRRSPPHERQGKCRKSRAGAQGVEPQMGRYQSALARFQDAAIRARLSRGNSRSRPAYHERDARYRHFDQKSKK